MTLIYSSKILKNYLDGFCILGKDWTFVRYTGTIEITSDITLPEWKSNANYFKGHPQWKGNQISSLIGPITTMQHNDECIYVCIHKLKLHYLFIWLIGMQMVQIPLWNTQQVPQHLAIAWIGKRTSNISYNKTSWQRNLAKLGTTVKEFLSDCILNLRQESPSRLHRRYNSAKAEKLRIYSEDDFLELATMFNSTTLMIEVEKFQSNFFEGPTDVVFMSCELGQNTVVSRESLPRHFTGIKVSATTESIVCHYAFDWTAKDNGINIPTRQFIHAKGVKDKLKEMGVAGKDIQMFPIALTSSESLPSQVEIGNIQCNTFPIPNTTQGGVAALNVYKKIGTEQKSNPVFSFKDYRISDFYNNALKGLLDKFLKRDVPWKGDPGKKTLPPSTKGPLRVLVEQTERNNLMSDTFELIQQYWKMDHPCRFEVIVRREIKKGCVDDVDTIVTWCLDVASDWLGSAGIFHVNDLLIHIPEEQITSLADSTLRVCFEKIQNFIALCNSLLGNANPLDSKCKFEDFTKQALACKIAELLLAQFLWGKCLDESFYKKCCQVLLKSLPARSYGSVGDGGLVQLDKDLLGLRDVLTKWNDLPLTEREVMDIMHTLGAKPFWLTTSPYKSLLELQGMWLEMMKTKEDSNSVIRGTTMPTSPLLRQMLSKLQRKLIEYSTSPEEESEGEKLAWPEEWNNRNYFTHMMPDNISVGMKVCFMSVRDLLQKLGDSTSLFSQPSAVPLYNYMRTRWGGTESTWDDSMAACIHESFSIYQYPLVFSSRVRKTPASRTDDDVDEESEEEPAPSSSGTPTKTPKNKNNKKSIKSTRDGGSSSRLIYVVLPTTPIPDVNPTEIWLRASVFRLGRRFPTPNNENFKGKLRKFLETAHAQGLLESCSCKSLNSLFLILEAKVVSLTTDTRTTTLVNYTQTRQQIMKDDKSSVIIPLLTRILDSDD